MTALLVMILPLTALGETAEIKTTLCEHEAGYYSFQYPADWTLLSKAPSMTLWQLRKRKKIAKSQQWLKR